MNFAVFGTSLLWGQGLNDADKIHNVLAQLWRTHHPTDEVNAYFFAHSGASTGFEEDGSVDTRREPAVHGEVPWLYPTILQEIEAFDALNVAPEDVNVVLLDAGVNDVHLTTILDPLTTPHQVKKLVEIYCHQHMKLLIERLLEKFKNAQIVIVGYYSFVTDQISKHFVHLLLQAIGKWTGGLLADLAIEVAAGVMRERLVANCDTFSEQSLAAFQEVALEINQQLPMPRVLVACPEIKPENTIFSADPWIYGINEDLSPQDPMASIRASNCHTAGLLPPKSIFCEKASLAHPNPKGARAYAELIFSLLQK